MVLSVDVAIVAIVTVLGAAYYYVIWDCARKNFVEKCRCNEQMLLLLLEFMERVRDRYPDDPRIAAIVDEYAAWLEEITKIKI